MFQEAKRQYPGNSRKQQFRMSPQPLVIIGAGVIGLSTAYLLQRQNPSRSITIIAAEVPTDSQPDVSPDYASMWAGAHYRPIPGNTLQLKRERAFCLRTVEAMKRIAKQFPESGVEFLNAIDLVEYESEDTAGLKRGQVFASEEDGFRILAKPELPNNVIWGAKYKTYCLNPHVYCRWLLNQFLDQGGKLVKKRLDKLEDAFSALNSGGSTLSLLVINCSGRNFDRDPSIKVMRGQTVLVKNAYHKTVTRQHADGEWIFLIPRPLGGGTVVGGTKEPGDYDVQVRPEQRTRILQRAVENFPDFVDDVSKFEIQYDIVGRRPWREGGVRIEVERLGNGQTVIHGYGAGGRGYEMSWGIAEDIISLVQANSAFSAKL